MGYFLWLNDRIDTTNAANVIAIINASNTDTGTTGPHDVGHADVAAGCGVLKKGPWETNNYESLNIRVCFCPRDLFYFRNFYFSILKFPFNNHGILSF